MKIPVLMYHSISSHASPRFTPCIIPPDMFEEQLSYLEQHNYTSLTITQLTLAQGGHGLPERPVILTFDDGFADFYTHAWPALRRHGFSATLYVVTGFVGGTSRWLEDMGEEARPMLSWEQLAEISAGGIECGAHTHTHPALDMLPPAVARDEIARSKDLLEEHLERSVPSFAYPFGYYNAQVRRLVQETGFTSACAINRALSSPRDNPYTITRLAIKPDASLHDFALALAGHGPLIASSIQRIRARLRQSMRTAYGRLRGNRHTTYQQAA
jgi:peptidoglycan/xylan/chitin deacetylase (PgdA/CDA1 family)